MKFSIAMLVVALSMFSAAGDVFAQEEQYERVPYRFTVTLDGGIGMPLGPDAFNSLWNASLPFTAAFGFLPVPYVEVKGWVTFASWGISGIPAKNAIGIEGTQDVTGGSVRTLFYGGSGKIMPLPNSQVLPFVEVGGGWFSASATDLEVENTLTNSMSDANGPAFLVGAGLEYAVNENWNTYARFNYLIGFDSSFSPGNLVRGPGEPEVEGGNLQVASILLGIILKI